MAEAGLAPGKGDLLARLRPGAAAEPGGRAQRAGCGAGADQGASASSNWSAEPPQFSSSTSRPLRSKKPRSSATGMGEWQKLAWLQAKVIFWRGCAPARPLNQAAEPSAPAAAPARKIGRASCRERVS